MLGDLKEGRPNLGPFDQSGNGHLIHFTSVPLGVRARLNGSRPRPKAREPGDGRLRAEQRQSWRAAAWLRPLILVA